MKYKFYEWEHGWSVNERNENNEIIKITDNKGEITELKYGENLIFIASNYGWVVKEIMDGTLNKTILNSFDENIATKITYSEGEVFEYIYDGIKHIKTFINGELVWSIDKDVQMTINKLKKYYDKVEYSFKNKSFKLTDKCGKWVEVFSSYIKNELGFISFDFDEFYLNEDALEILRKFFKNEEE